MVVRRRDGTPRSRREGTGRAIALTARCRSKAQRCSVGKPSYSQPRRSAQLKRGCKAEQHRKSNPARAETAQATQPVPMLAPSCTCAVAMDSPSAPRGNSRKSIKLVQNISQTASRQKASGSGARGCLVARLLLARHCAKWCGNGDLSEQVLERRLADSLSGFARARDESGSCGTPQPSGFLPSTRMRCAQIKRDREDQRGSPRVDRIEQQRLVAADVVRPYGRSPRYAEGVAGALRREDGPVSKEAAPEARGAPQEPATREELAAGHRCVAVSARAERESARRHVHKRLAISQTTNQMTVINEPRLRLRVLAARDGGYLQTVSASRADGIGTPSRQ